MKIIKYIVYLYEGFDWRKSKQEYDSYEEAEHACERSLYSPAEYRIEPVEREIKEEE